MTSNVWILAIVTSLFAIFSLLFFLASTMKQHQSASSKTVTTGSGVGLVKPTKELALNTLTNKSRGNDDEFNDGPLDLSTILNNFNITLQTVSKARDAYSTAELMQWDNKQWLTFQEDMSFFDEDDDAPKILSMTEITELINNNRAENREQFGHNQSSPTPHDPNGSSSS